MRTKQTLVRLRFGDLFLLLLFHSTSNDTTVKFAVVTAACSIGLVLQCVLLLYSTFAESHASNTRTVVALVLLLIIELLPGGAMVITMRQPRATADSWIYRDWLWCFADGISQTTSLSGNSRNVNKSQQNSAL